MDLKGVEIFAVGTWRGNKKITVTEADLDQMVASFEALGANVPGFRPSIKLGHSNNPGEQAYGWVSRVWKNGEKVLADFVDMPDHLGSAIKARRYDAVSVEMYPSLDYKGKTYQNVLSAVAVLGSELPAVKGLKPLSELSFAGLEGVERLSKEEEAMFTQEQMEVLVRAAVNEAKAAFTAEHKDEITSLTAKVTEVETKLTEANERVQRADAALATFKADNAEKELIALADQAVKDGKILPTQKDAMLAMARSMTGTIKLAEKDVTAIDVLKQFIDGGKAAVDLSEKGGDKLPNEKRAGLEVDKRAKGLQAQTGNEKLSYSDAVKKVLASDPALKQSYLSEV